MSQHPAAIDRFIERYLPRNMHDYLQDEARHLQILVQHTIYSCRVDLHDDTLVQREDAGA
jgi:hypothetical protein